MAGSRGDVDAHLKSIIMTGLKICWHKGHFFFSPVLFICSNAGLEEVNNRWIQLRLAPFQVSMIKEREVLKELRAFAKE